MSGDIPDSLTECQEALRVAWGLLEEHDRLLTAIPECSRHGACIPHALEWVQRQKDRVPDTKTLSLSHCPACHKPHYLPLVFVETAPGQWQGQCINNLQPVYAALDAGGRLVVKESI